MKPKTSLVVWTDENGVPRVASVKMTETEIELLEHALYKANVTGAQLSIYDPEPTITFEELTKLLKPRFGIRISPKDWRP